jgi:signal transduction histidine kinase
VQARRSIIAEWMFVAVLGLCCAALAVLQYRWTGQITRAERERMRADVRDRLLAFRRDFDESLYDSMRALSPRFGAGASGASVKPCPFRRAGLAVFRPGSFEWLRHDAQTGGFASDELPREWSALRDGAGFHARPLDSDRLQLGEDILSVDMRGPGGRGPHPPAERVVLVAEIDRSCVQQKLIPELAAEHLSQQGRLQYDLKVLDRENPSRVIYVSSDSAKRLTTASADDFVALDLNLHGPGRPGAPPPNRTPGFRRPQPDLSHESPPPEPNERFDGPPPGRSGKEWLLLVRPRAGSLEALVESQRRRNIAVSGGMLLLIVATGAALVRFTRASQRLAALRMNIVAGVSHELRSPLTVIRTAAFNLQREGFSNRPDQVRRYGELIGVESTRLERLVENVLRFATMSRGRMPGERTVTNIGETLQSEIEFFKDVFAASGIRVETDIPRELPAIAADRESLRHALRNILENAMKYGGSGEWIGVSARKAGNAIEIRIADRGPGIPPEERERIFEPFFRGSRAIRDQASGAGLGLSLAAEIARIHGGSIAAGAGQEGGSAITVRLPIASAERASE